MLEFDSGVYLAPCLPDEPHHHRGDLRVLRGRYQIVEFDQMFHS